MDTPFKPNTPQDPFYRSPVPVEVKWRGGKTGIIICPRCATSSTASIVEWRAASAEQLAAFQRSLPPPR